MNFCDKFGTWLEWSWFMGFDLNADSSALLLEDSFLIVNDFFIECCDKNAVSGIF